MARVLVVSRHFPPLSSAGSSIRLVKFIKYISSWDWKFVIFTQDIYQTVIPEQVLSSFLLDELPSDVKIQRIAAPFSLKSQNNVMDGIRKILQKFLMDSSLGWGLNVFLSGLKEINKSKVDLIFGVAPPFTNALIGMLIAWGGRKPFILDLKDDWVGSPSFLQKNAFRQNVETLLEGLIVRNASAVITVTQQSYNLYNQRYEQLHMPEKFHFIPNGCDLDEYEHLDTRKKKVESNRFLILSAAWGFRKNYRDIGPFFFALNKFFSRHPDAREKVDVFLLGDSLSDEYDKLLFELKLNEVVQSPGAVKRDKLVEWLWKADLFLLIQPIGNSTAISGTLYEYWATGKAPVLLISEEGASSTLVVDNQIGKHFTFEQVEQIANYIEKIYDSYQSGQPIWIERRGIRNFDRKVLAKRMEIVWHEALT